MTDGRKLAFRIAARNLQSSAAYSREAWSIKAFGLRHLTNSIHSNSYLKFDYSLYPYLAIYDIFRSMQEFLVEPTSIKVTQIKNPPYTISSSACESFKIGSKILPAVSRNEKKKKVSTQEENVRNQQRKRYFGRKKGLAMRDYHIKRKKQELATDLE